MSFLAGLCTGKHFIYKFCLQTAPHWRRHERWLYNKRLYFSSWFCRTKHCFQAARCPLWSDEYQWINLEIIYFNSSSVRCTLGAVGPLIKKTLMNCDAHPDHLRLHALNHCQFLNAVAIRSTNKSLRLLSASLFNKTMNCQSVLMTNAKIQTRDCQARTE